jgi:hypothetical protein
MSAEEWFRYVVVRTLSAWGNEQSGRVRRASDELWPQKWFGIIPLGLKLWWRGRRRRKARTPGP